MCRIQCPPGTVCVSVRDPFERVQLHCCSRPQDSRWQPGCLTLCLVRGCGRLGLLSRGGELRGGLHPSWDILALPEENPIYYQAGYEADTVTPSLSLTPF